MEEEEKRKLADECFDTLLRPPIEMDMEEGAKQAIKNYRKWIAKKFVDGVTPEEMMEILDMTWNSTGCRILSEEEVNQRMWGIYNSLKEKLENEDAEGEK